MQIMKNCEDYVKTNFPGDIEYVTVPVTVTTKIFKITKIEKLKNEMGKKQNLNII